MAWTLTGETGKAFDASSDRPLAALNINSARLSFRTLAADTLTWSAVTTSASGAGTTIPEEGQKIILKLDGASKFTGWVTKVSVRLRSVEVEVSGPWWWLEQTPILDADDRVKIAFARGAQVMTSLTTVLTAARSEHPSGQEPFDIGAMDAGYTLAQETFSLVSCADVVAGLLRWVPDAVAWFDYSAATPVFRVSRRAAMIARTDIRTFAVGTDVIDLDIAPATTLQVAEVRLNAIDRVESTGVETPATYSAGTPAPGRVQVITLSGPELDTFRPAGIFGVTLPELEVASQTVNGGSVPGQTIPGYELAVPNSQSYSIYTTTITYANIFTRLPSVLQPGPWAQMLADYGQWPLTESTAPCPLPHSMSSASTYEVSSGSAGDSFTTYNQTALQITNPTTGATVSTTGKYFCYNTTTPPSWMATDYPAVTFTRVRIRGSFWVIRRRSYGRNLTSSLNKLTVDGIGPPQWLPAIQSAGGSLIRTGYNPANYPAEQSLIDLWRVPFDVEALLVNVSKPSGYVYGQADSAITTPDITVDDRSVYDLFIAGQELPGGTTETGQLWGYESPPLDLATNLLAAQSWLPWAGRIDALPATEDGANLISKTIRVTGSRTAAATMDALARSVEWTLGTGRCSVEIGPPARHDWRSVVSRLRRNPQDSVYFV